MILKPFICRMRLWIYKMPYMRFSFKQKSDIQNTAFTIHINYVNKKRCSFVIDTNGKKESATWPKRCTGFFKELQTNVVIFYLDSFYVYWKNPVSICQVVICIWEL